MTTFHPGGGGSSLTSCNTFSWHSELGSESLNEMLKPIQHDKEYSLALRERDRGLSSHKEMLKQVQHDKNIIPSTFGAKGANEVRVVRPCFRSEVEVRGVGVRVKAAFTLAEVLITLAIIGVVAAMTIPTLVANYQNKTWSTSASVFERKLEEALKTMNTQQSLAGYKNTADFVAELGKHFKINKVCQNSDIKSCFNENITWEIIDISSGSKSEKIVMPEIKTAADLGQDDWDSEALGVQFANGTTGIIAYNPDCNEQPYTNTFTGTSCISLIYDTNGFKSPNTYTKDVREINSFLKSCAFKSGSTCFSAPFKPDSLTKAECEELKGELGIEECYYNTDYWSGAVKACGGVSKMLTQTQLNDIANYVYNTTGINYIATRTNGNIFGLTLDYDKVAELGFTASAGTPTAFLVFTNDEVSKAQTYRLEFYPKKTFWGLDIRSSLRQAVCIGD